MATTGLRVGELPGLQWRDIGFEVLKVHLSRAIVDGVVGELKTEASRKPVPLDPALAEVLLNWRDHTLYNCDEDWVFASPKSRADSHTCLTAHCEGPYGQPQSVPES